MLVQFTVTVDGREVSVFHGKFQEGGGDEAEIRRKLPRAVCMIPTD
jgi:hypothetical protein